MTRGARAAGLLAILATGCGLPHTIRMYAPRGTTVTVDQREPVAFTAKMREESLDPRGPHTIVLSGPSGATESHAILSSYNRFAPWRDLVVIPAIMGLLVTAVSREFSAKAIGTGFGMTLVTYSLIRVPTGVTGGYYRLTPSEIRSALPASTPGQASRMPPLIPPGARLAVAVMDLQPINVSATDAKIVTDLVRTGLAAEETFTVIDRSRIEGMLGAQAAELAACAEQTCAIKLGGLLNVQAMIIGSFARFQDEYLLTIRVVDVETAHILYSGSVRGKNLAAIEHETATLRAAVRERFRPPGPSPTAPHDPPPGAPAGAPIP